MWSTIVGSWERMSAVLTTDECAELVSILSANPDEPGPNFSYAQCLIDSQQFGLAEVHLKRALAKDPSNADYLALFAHTLAKQERIPEAETILRQLMTSVPDNALAFRSLGILRLDQNSFRDAKSALEQSVALDAQDAKAWNCLGIALVNCSLLSESENAFRKAIRLHPDYENAHSNLVSVLERRNKVSAARKALDEGKKRFPGSDAFVLFEAIVLRREGRDREAIRLLEGGGYRTDPMTVIQAHAELGRLYDRLDRPAQAFEHLRTYNAKATEFFGITPAVKRLYLEEIANYRETFTKAFVDSWDTFDDYDGLNDPVFLFGFVRSGTTLLQHILGSHPSIYATDEVPALPRVIEQIESQIGGYPECLKTLDTGLIKELRQLYYHFQRQEPEWDDREILVDKYPLMGPLIGPALRMFPKAKMLFLARHPCDCILSSYMHLMMPNNASVHFYDLEDTVNVYCEVMDLWLHYEATLPLTTHYVRYEDIVSNFQPKVKEVLDFIGVEWNDAVLRYYSNASKQAGIRTPSYDQVNQKIYDHARYRWLRYRPHLEPYLERLEPYATRFGYTID